MKRITITATAILILQPGFTVNGQEGYDQVLDVSTLVPSTSSIPGWTVADELKEYAPGDLYEYIDGAAPRYLSYGFRKLAHIRYAFGGQDLVSVTLDLYDMGSVMGAYGIYSSGRSRNISVRPWGTEGYRAGIIAAAWKGRFYIHAAADDESPVLLATLEHLMDRVTATIPGGDTRPEILSALPQDGLIPYTDRYIGKDLFGHSFLPGGILANYESGGDNPTLFVSDLGSSKAAEEAFAAFRLYELDSGTVLKAEERVGEEGFWAEDPGLGIGVVIRVGSYVGGLWEVPSEAWALHTLGQLVTRLKQHASPLVSLHQLSSRIIPSALNRNKLQMPCLCTPAVAGL